MDNIMDEFTYFSPGPAANENNPIRGLLKLRCLIGSELNWINQSIEHTVMLRCGKPIYSFNSFFLHCHFNLYRRERIHLLLLEVGVFWYQLIHCFQAGQSGACGPAGCRQEQNRCTGTLYVLRCTQMYQYILVCTLSIRKINQLYLYVPV